MKAIDLYKFVTKHECEYHWNDENSDVILFVNIWGIEEFQKIIGAREMDEEGIPCVMKDKYFCFWMYDICEYHDIELTDIFEPEE